MAHAKMLSFKTIRGPVFAALAVTTRKSGIWALRTEIVLPACLRIPAHPAFTGRVDGGELSIGTIENFRSELRRFEACGAPDRGCVSRRAH